MLLLYTTIYVNVLAELTREDGHMYQIVTEKPGVVKLVQADMPKPQKGHALLKMVCGGICGSDLGVYKGTFAYGGYPRIPGHEVAAEIVEIEDNDLGLACGMLVTVNPYFNCGSCYSCERGMVNCCMQNETMGAQRDGAYSEYFTIPIERIYNGKGLDPHTLALIEPFAIAYHGVKRARPQKGERVLVIGGGTIGILAAKAAQYLGATVYVADVSRNKLDIAKRMGADGVILSGSKEEFDRQVNEVTDGNGFDITIEAVGLPQTFQNAVDSAAFGGRVVLIGISMQSLDFGFTVIQKKELAIFGSRNAHKQDFLELIDIVRDGKLCLDGMVTSTFPISRAEQAFHTMATQGDSNLKIMLEF